MTPAVADGILPVDAAESKKNPHLVHKWQCGCKIMGGPIIASAASAVSAMTRRQRTEGRMTLKYLLS